jgi:hypothetical protein
LIFQSARGCCVAIDFPRQPARQTVGRTATARLPAALTSAAAAAAFTLRGNRIDQQHLRTKATLPKPRHAAAAPTTQLVFLGRKFFEHVTAAVSFTLLIYY